MIPESQAPAELHCANSAARLHHQQGVYCNVAGANVLATAAKNARAYAGTPTGRCAMRIKQAVTTITKQWARKKTDGKVPSRRPCCCEPSEPNKIINKNNQVIQ